MIQLDEAYFEGVENDVSLPTEESDVILAVLIGIIKGIVSFASLYYIGIKLGGNTNWKKVFSVFFHTYVPVIPMMIVLSILVFFMWSSLAEIDPSYLMSPDIDEEEALSMIGPMLGYVGLLVVAAIAFMVWIIVISVKAIRIVDGFETGKAFGLLILVMIISSVVSFVLNV